MPEKKGEGMRLFLIFALGVLPALAGCATRGWVEERLAAEVGPLGECIARVDAQQTQIGQLAEADTALAQDIQEAETQLATLRKDMGRLSQKLDELLADLVFSFDKLASNSEQLIEHMTVQKQILDAALSKLSPKTD